MDEDRLQIGEFAALVGLSIPQLRRYDHLRLLEPAGRSAESGYRYYSSGQTGAARVIALLRSMDMPIAEIRLILAGADEDARRRIFRDHRARLEARLDEVRRLMEAVDTMTQEGRMGTDTELSSWQHVMPYVHVSDMERSIAYYQEAMGLRLDWRHASGNLAGVSSGDIETILLRRWDGEGAPPPMSAYVYVEDPDALCAEYTEAGADIASPVDSRAYGMRDFVVRDPDGNRFTLGRGEERLKGMTDQYLLEGGGEVSVDFWKARRS